MFNVVDTKNQSRVGLNEALDVAGHIGTPFVPVLERGDSFGYSADDLLDKAKGLYKDNFPGARNMREREGIVVRSLCGFISFKAINNNFLPKED